MKAVYLQYNEQVIEMFQRFRYHERTMLTSNFSRISILGLVVYLEMVNSIFSREGYMMMNDEEMKKILMEEVKKIERVARYRAGAHNYDARYWTLYHRSLGIPLAIVSAVAGASALSSFVYHNVIAGVLSLLVAVLTPISTFFKPSEKAAEHQDYCGKYITLRDEAQNLYIDADFLNMPNKALRDHLGKLMSELEALDKNSPLILNRRYKMFPTDEDLKRPLS